MGDQASALAGRPSSTRTRFDVCVHCVFVVSLWKSLYRGGLLREEIPRGQFCERVHLLELGFGGIRDLASRFVRPLLNILCVL